MGIFSKKSKSDGLVGILFRCRYCGAEITYYYTDASHGDVYIAPDRCSGNRIIKGGPHSWKRIRI